MAEKDSAAQMGAPASAPGLWFHPATAPQGRPVSNGFRRLLLGYSGLVQQGRDLRSNTTGLLHTEDVQVCQGQSGRLYRDMGVG